MTIWEVAEKGAAVLGGISVLGAFFVVFFKGSIIFHKSQQAGDAFEDYKSFKNKTDLYIEALAKENTSIKKSVEELKDDSEEMQKKLDNILFELISFLKDRI